VIGLLSNDGQYGSYPVETRAGSRASDFEAEYTWSSGRYVMRAVVLHEDGGPEKLKFEDNVPFFNLADVCSSFADILSPSQTPE
jgi:hypothetical protein